MVTVCVLCSIGDKNVCTPATATIFIKAVNKNEDCQLIISDINVANGTSNTGATVRFEKIILTDFNLTSGFEVFSATDNAIDQYTG